MGSELTARQLMENRVIIEPKIEPPTMIPTEVKPRQRTKPKAIKKGMCSIKSQYGIKTQLEYGILPEVQKVVAAVKEKEKKKSTKCKSSLYHSEHAVTIFRPM